LSAVFDLTGSEFSKFFRLQRTSLQNFKTIGTCVPELLTIKQSFYVGFRWYLENDTSVLNRTWSDLHQFNGDIVRASLQTRFKNGADISLRIRTTALKDHTFGPRVKISGRWEDISVLWSSVRHDWTSGIHLMRGRCMICRGKGRTVRSTAAFIKVFLIRCRVA